MKYTNTYGDGLNLAVLPPTIQLEFVDFTDNILTWVRGNGDKALILLRQLIAVDEEPYDGVTYVVGGYHGLNKVIYRGVGTSIDLSDLDDGVWWVAGFEFNGFAGVEKYLRPGDVFELNITSVDSFILREDGFYILREDGFKIKREG